MKPIGQERGAPSNAKLGSSHRWAGDLPAPPGAQRHAFFICGP